MKDSAENYPLNSEQRNIVTASPSQSQLVVAPPGAGKTHIVVGRIQYLIEKAGLIPSELLVLCFTRTAVAEITGRLKDMVKNQQIHDDLRFVSVRTFDSFATRMLVAADTECDLSGFSYDARIELAIEALSNPNSDASCIVSSFRHLIVDEIQDLVGVRARLVQQLIERVSGGFTLLGDPAQAIYNFSDNSKEKGNRNTLNIFAWMKQQEWFQGVLERTLTENYRSSGELAEKVLSIRSEVISQDPEDFRALEKLRNFVKELNGAGSGIDPALPIQEADDSLCVLCRSNGEVLQLASLFSLKGIQYVIKPRPDDNGLPAWLGRVLGSYTESKISSNEFHDRWNGLVTKSLPVAVSQAWGWLKKIEGSEKSDLDINILHQHLFQGNSLPDDTDAFVGIHQNNVSISTIHAVKGREFDQVVILQPYVKNQSNSKNTLEEARILYVAATRARREITRLQRNGLPNMWKVDCGNGRSRWVANHSRSGYFFMEVGLPGDYDVLSSVSCYLHSTPGSAEEVQNYLWEKAAPGDVVKIKKVRQGKYSFFHILSQKTGNQDMRILGQLSLGFKNDLAKVLEKICKGKFYYPNFMDGIQIAAIVTELLPPYSEKVHNPYAASRFSLGLRLRGMGYIYKENGS
jgi:hypothetical protein